MTRFLMGDKVIFHGQEGKKKAIHLTTSRKGEHKGQACIQFEDCFIAWVPVETLSKDT